ncbi:hypothetical protein B0J13DRAFT_607948 [Dactylonectria estremocensis]|uniref:RNase MRP protein 1 RNA binding domain-containing protein n=1 Tax=Dactylonectria estremocensis TaxID=1079267 RepID=A0A9P9J7J9_9HYPO|nr:hypothetical protein B0J13DRAFT_607948 [Dactylonectria estremocensis]
MSSKPSSTRLPPPAAPSPETLSDIQTSLTPIIHILRAVAHRHRNQHSASHWWASFAFVRRAVRNLKSALLRPSPRTAVVSPPVLQAKHIVHHVVPRAFIAFTQLAADNQHAPLGLLLLGVLARIKRLLSDLVPSDNISKSSPIPTTEATRNSGLPPARSDEVVDLGVAISRDELLPKPSSRESGCATAEEARSKDIKDEKHAQSTIAAIKETPVDSLSKKKKKKKKGGDALSSLFGSL